MKTKAQRNWKSYETEHYKRSIFSPINNNWIDQVVNFEFPLQCFCWAVLFHFRSTKNGAHKETTSKGEIRNWLGSFPFLATILFSFLFSLFSAYFLAFAQRCFYVHLNKNTRDVRVFIFDWTTEEEEEEIVRHPHQLNCIGVHWLCVPVSVFTQNWGDDARWKKMDPADCRNGFWVKNQELNRFMSRWHNNIEKCTK